MKNHTNGWQKAIDAANARIENGITVDLKTDAPQPPVKQEPEAPVPLATEADQRIASIENFCAKLGVPMGIARKYTLDVRPFHRVANDILARHMLSRAGHRRGIL